MVCNAKYISEDEANKMESVKHCFETRLQICTSREKEKKRKENSRCQQFLLLTQTMNISADF